MTKDEWIKKLENFIQGVIYTEINPSCQIFEDDLLKWAKLNAQELLDSKPRKFKSRWWYIR